jgi:hypothetical protein
MNLDQPACPMSGLLSEVSLYPTATVPHAVPTAFSAYDMNLDQPACASESPCDDQTSSVEQASSAADALGEDYASWIKKVEGMSEKEIDEQLKLAPLCDIDLTVPSTILDSEGIRQLKRWVVKRRLTFSNGKYSRGLLQRTLLDYRLEQSLCLFV